MMEELEKYDLIFCAGSKLKSRSLRSLVLKLLILRLRPDLGLVASSVVPMLVGFYQAFTGNYDFLHEATVDRLSSVFG